MSSAKWRAFFPGGDELKGSFNKHDHEYKVEEYPPIPTSFANYTQPLLGY